MNDIEVRLDRPVQYLIMNRGDEEWYDCIVSEDGLTIQSGVDGSGRQHPIGIFLLRNTPLVYHREIDRWYKEEAEKLARKRDDLYREGDKRLAAVKFRYKSKSELKKEKTPTKHSGKKEYQIKS